jgi:hypothetical protein
VYLVRFIHGVLICFALSPACYQGGMSYVAGAIADALLPLLGTLKVRSKQRNAVVSVRCQHDHTLALERAGPQDGAGHRVPGPGAAAEPAAVVHDVGCAACLLTSKVGTRVR